MNRRFVTAILLLLSASSPASARPADGHPFFAHDFDVVRALEQQFVFPKEVTKKRPAPGGQWSIHPFSAFATASDIVAAINADFTAAFRDGHLLLRRALPADMAVAIGHRGGPPIAARAAMDKREPEINDATTGVTVLECNVGELELTEFAECHLPALKRAMSFTVGVLVTSGDPLQFTESIPISQVATHEEDSCHDAGTDECPSEPIPAPAKAILDCEDPRIADMLGSCDLPMPTFPSLHVATVHKGGNGFVIAARDGSPERVTNGSDASRVDAALPLALFKLAPSPRGTPLPAFVSDIKQDISGARLDRPPRR